MFQLEMDYCGPLGLRHSEFHSWPQDDQDKAIAWTLGKARRCGQCGTVSDDWLDEEGEYREPPPYLAKSKLCGGCQAIHDKMDLIPDDRKSFTHVYLEPWSSDGIDVRQDRPTG